MVVVVRQELYLRREEENVFGAFRHHKVATQLPHLWLPTFGLLVPFEGEWRVYIKNIYLKQALGFLLFEDESKAILISMVIFLSLSLPPFLSPYFYYMLFYPQIYD